MRPLLSSATVAVLRDGVDEVETYVMQRHRKSPFMPSLWVFPGGRCEDHDAEVVPGVLPSLPGPCPFGLDPDDALARRVAAVRETFEESGLWLGPGPAPSEEDRVRLDAGELRLHEVVRHGTADWQRLRPWARWFTPEAAGRRYDATIFVAAAGEGDASHCAREMEAGEWVPLSRIAAGEAGVPMAPPTWWTVHQLIAASAHGGVAAILAASASRDLTAVMPVPVMGEGLSFALPGHPQHPLSRREDLPQGSVWKDGTWAPILL